MPRLSGSLSLRFRESDMATKGARVQGCKLCMNGALHPWRGKSAKGAMQCTYYVGDTAFAPFSPLLPPTPERMH